MKINDYTVKTTEALCEEFSTDIEKGLSFQKANTIRKKYGPNSLEENGVTWLDILLRQFKSAFIYLLVAAAVIAFFLGNRFDSLMIIIFIVINAVLGFYQEFKSEKSLKYLKKLSINQARVLRGGNLHYISSIDLVPGDIVFLETGDIVPADIRIVREDDFYTDESSLTGESIPVKKTSEVFKEGVSQLYEAKNMAFMGTVVVDGSSSGIVIATGKNTEMGKIAKLTAGTKSASGFEKSINKFSKFTLILTLVTLALVFVAHLFIKKSEIPIPELALFSIALAVGVVPEALPLVTTFSLTQGAMKLAKKKVVVKRLSAIEDLGSIQVLCSDKTGTLTQNSLSVAEVFSQDEKKTLYYSALACDLFKGKKTAVNSFDTAIFKKIGRADLEEIKKTKRLSENPFNPKRRRNSVLVKISDKKYLVVRGAQESVLPYVKNLNKEDEEKIMKWIWREGKKGRRVIAIAKREFDKDSYDVKDEEESMEFEGMISFSDPIKSSAKEAVKKAKNLGIELKIITGDSTEVAGAVAYEVGISRSSAEVISGFDFENLSLEEKKEAVEKFNVFSRVSPEQKFQIIELLQKKHTVGYLGDGINDAPALKLADVAIVVNKASDVAREASDIILFQQDLKILVDGIEEGRKTFVNTSNYIKSTLSSNFGNFYAMTIASLLIDYLPMLPVQILLVNLLSDFPMISIATDNVDPDEIKRPCFYNNSEIVITATFLGIVSTIFDLTVFAIFSKHGADVLRTVWFIESIMTELILIFSIRTKHLAFKAKSSPSAPILLLTSIAAISTVLITFLPVGSMFFGFTHPSVYSLKIVGIIIVGYFISSEIVKMVLYKRRSQKVVVYNRF